MLRMTLFGLLIYVGTQCSTNHSTAALENERGEMLYQ
jgi:hypothetical protein